MIAPRVLIADDNAVNRFAVRALVERSGYEVELAVSGEEAIALSAVEAFSAILIDIVMPDVTGYAAARRIRALGVKTPIIASTALDDTEELRSACRDAGIDDTLFKPLDPERLRSTLARWVGDGGGRTVRESAPAIRAGALRDLYGDDDLRAIWQAFFEVTTALLRQLETALQRREEHAAARAVHELRSASAELQLTEIGELCGSIEAARRSQDWQTMSALYATLADSLSAVRAILQRTAETRLARSAG
jgi:CheY-like chemotaxis protein/HPt (histidine-containing phosphotransfer) domain-containing protein